MAILKSISTRVPKPPTGKRIAPASVELWPGTPNSLYCTRAAGIADKDRRIQEADEWRDCVKRREEPGYEKIMDTRYKG